jgi:hypothetical protein
VLRAPFALVSLLLLVGGCSLAISPGEEQCEVDADCDARGFDGAVCEAGVCAPQCEVDADCEARGFDGNACEAGKCVVVNDPSWGCLGNVAEPEPDPSIPLTIQFRLAYATDSTLPVVGATVDICSKLDLECMNDSPGFPKGLMSDADGVLRIDTRQGFDGFVRIAHPEIVDSRIYVGRPLLEQPKTEEIRLLKPLEYEVLANSAGGAQVDPTRGTAIVLGLDCQGLAGSQLRFSTASADAQTIPFYLVNQAPQQPPQAIETDPDGFGGFFNLPTGPTVVVAVRGTEETFVGRSSVDILANTISYVQVAPTPQ